MRSLRKSYPYLPERLNVAELAVCLECSEELVRRKLRANIHGIRRYADGPPWRVAQAALGLFKVSPAAGLNLLQRQVQLRSGGDTLPPVSPPVEGSAVSIPLHRAV